MRRLLPVLLLADPCRRPASDRFTAPTRSAGLLALDSGPLPPTVDAEQPLDHRLQGSPTDSARVARWADRDPFAVRAHQRQVPRFDAHVGPTLSGIRSGPSASSVTSVR